MPEGHEAAQSIADVPEWIATLVRGLHYDLRGEVFEANVPRPCFDHQKRHLEEHAVLVVDTPGWNPEYDDEDTRSTRVPMFDFKPNDGSADGALSPAIGSEAMARMRTFDERETVRLRTKRIAEKNAGLSDYTTPATIEEARAVTISDAPTDAPELPRARRPKYPVRS